MVDILVVINYHGGP